MTDSKKFTSFPIANTSQVFGSNTWLLAADLQSSANGVGNDWRVTPSIIVQVGELSSNAQSQFGVGATADRALQAIGARLGFSNGSAQISLTAASANLSLSANQDGGICHSNNANATLVFANTLPDGFRQEVVVVDSESTLTIETTGLTVVTKLSSYVANSPGTVFNILKLGSNLIIS